MRIRVYDNALELPEKYYAPIGEVIFRFAQLEYQMQEIIWRTLRVDNKVGRTLTVGMGNRVLRGVIRNLAKNWLTTKLEKRMALSIVDGAQDVEDLRNQLAHGSWQYPQDGRKTDVWMHYMKDGDQRIMPKAKRHPPREIRKRATQLRKLNTTAQKLIHRLDKRQIP